jgi:hypothetical protein
MEKKIKIKMFLAMSIVKAFVFLNGCSGPKQVKTGFLSDYSRLQRETPVIYRMTLLCN